MKPTIFILITGLAIAAEPEQLQERSVLRLSLKRAVEIGLAPEGNAAIQLAGEEIRQAEARSMQDRAALLPDLTGSASTQSVTRNLRSMGLDENISAFGIPRSVGPFNVFDARVSMTQNLLDLSSIQRYKA